MPGILEPGDVFHSKELMIRPGRLRRHRERRAIDIVGVDHVGVRDQGAARSHVKDRSADIPRRSPRRWNPRRVHRSSIRTDVPAPRDAHLAVRPSTAR